MAIHDTTALALVQQLLRGDLAPWPEDATPGLADTLYELAQVHGVLALLHQRGLPAGWPDALRARLRTAATQQAMWELRHQQLLRAALAGLQAAGVQPVLFKGTPLAYALYPEPTLRQRADTDMLVPPALRDRAVETLQSLGWTAELAVRGDYISYQATLTRHTTDGVHAIDLHWRFNNAQVLASLFGYEELRARARPVPSLAPEAWGPDDVDSLLIACTHRATHAHNPYHVDGQAHHNPDRVIWLTDIDLLARRFDAARWQAFTQRAGDKQLRRVCLAGLHAASAALATPVPPEVIGRLAAAGAEPPCDYLASGRVRQFWLDITALPAAARLRYLRELVFPPADYMHARFGVSGGALPLMYVRRAAGGLLKRLRPHA